MNLGMISFWHVHAKDYAKEAELHPDTQVKAIWDEDENRGREEAKVRQVEYISELDQLLGMEEIDAVVVDSPTNTHKDVILKAARAGKHIFTEKVLAATEKEALEILDAVKEAGVKLFVSLPRVYDGYTEAIQDLIHSGELGDITQTRVRLAHNGATADWLPQHFYNKEECQGGALIDLGCHPVYLTRLFQGMPNRVTAQFGYVTRKAVEDQAVVTFGYDNGSYGIAETGFVTAHSPFTIEVHGTKGTALYGTPDKTLLKKIGSEWEEVAIPSDHPSPFSQWVEHIQKDQGTDENNALALELTVLMEAAYKAEEQKREVEIGGR
ncbi:Gfo/Idh/MocA family protein [Guptibacillus hwajinpoensis]|uniref:Dehydrogenase n=1 Tax=Guptibacillus hwajinpoensis TaxID=208199 RepID=A0ABU0JYJ9_9BACL|nr:Gfo/Idh/MocA family oxidoreductase [Alkalihalobacillus hemicentroti]MDQ0482128.1 putative dehydrogenase [Alkalihalobacillus hemicentroti]